MAIVETNPAVSSYTTLCPFPFSSIAVILTTYSLETSVQSMSIYCIESPSELKPYFNLLAISMLPGIKSEYFSLLSDPVE
ncbi:hypothetical protein D3C81_2066960 [compost metagenome]